MNNKLRIILVLAIVQIIYAQNMSAVNLDEILGNQMSFRGANMNSAQQQPSMMEMMYIQQMLSQQRTGLGGLTGQSQFFQNDSTNLFLNVADSALGRPLNFMTRDTLKYVRATDTISIDSLSLYEDIEEIGRITPDGKRRVVVRKKLVPRDVSMLRRYESDFFKTANPTIFSGVTSGVTGNYPLKPGDELILTIWGAVEKEANLKISNQGMVNVESVGMVSLNGTTLAAAEGILKTRLSKVYSGINRGQTFVNLRLEALSPVKVFILGEVEKPGAYVFYGNTTVFQALYMAEGPNKNGSVRSVQIARQDSIFTIDLYEYLMHGKNVNGAPLFDGDIVFLPRAKVLAEVDGAVGRPAIYELKEGEGVKELLTFASGVNSNVAEQNMVLKRIFHGGRTDFETILKPSDYTSGKDSLKLRDGDALFVFTSAERSMQNTTILGAIKYPGTYKLETDMTAVDLVRISGGLVEAGYPGRVHVLRAIPQGGYELLSQNLENEKAIKLNPRDTIVVYSAKEMYRPDSVSIGGAVLKPGYYTYYEGMDAKDLLLMAGGYLAEARRGTIYISRMDKGGHTVKNTPYSVPDNYDENQNFDIKLVPWDHVEIQYNSDFYRPELVVLSGAFKNPGVYSLNFPEEPLERLITRAGGFLESSYLDGAKFYRRSLSAEAPEYTLVGVDFERTLKKDSRNNVKLMDGDSIYIPEKSISVKVSGEVGLVTNVLWKKNAKVSWYIDQAGGFKITGDEERVMIKYANGSVSLASNAERPPDPGSEIIIPHKNPPQETRWTEIVTAFGTVASGLGALAMAISTMVLLSR